MDSLGSDMSTEIKFDDEVSLSSEGRSKENQLFFSGNTMTRHVLNNLSLNEIYYVDDVRKKLGVRVPQANGNKP